MGTDAQIGARGRVGSVHTLCSVGGHVINLNGIFPRAEGDMTRRALELGNLSFAERDYITASHFFYLALGEDPDNTEVRNKLIRSLDAARQSDQIAMLALVELEEDGADSDIFEILSRLYRRQGLTSEAIHILQRGSERFPEETRFPLLESDLLLEHGLGRDARRSLVKSMAHNGPDPDLVLKLCDTWIEEANYFQAKMVLSLCPDRDIVSSAEETIARRRRIESFPQSSEDFLYWNPKEAFKAQNRVRQQRFLRNFFHVADLLDSIRELPDTQRIHVKISIQRAAKSAYWLSQLSTATQKTASTLKLITVIILALKLPYALQGPTTNLLTYPFKNFGPSYILTIFVGVTLITFTLDHIPGRNIYLLTLLLSGYIAAFYSISYRGDFSSMPPPVRLGVASGLALIVISLLVLTLSSILINVVLRYIFRRRRARHIEEFAIISLLDLLHAIRFEARWRGTALETGELVSRLDHVVRDFKSYLRYKRADLDRDLARWHSSSAEGKVFALTDLRRWLAMPMATTLEDTEARILKYLQAIISGELGMLPWEDPQPAIRRLRAERMAATLRALLAAAIPAILLVLAQILPIDFDPSIIRGIQVFAFAYATISLVIHLDPKLAEKIEIIQKLRNIHISRPGSSGQGP